MKKKDSTALAVKTMEVPQVQAQAITPAERMITMIFEAAHDKELDIDKLERLIALQQVMLADQRKASFDDSMSRVQAKITPILQLGTRAERQKGKYAKFDDIKEMLRPILAEEVMSTSFSEVEKFEKQTKFVLKVSKGGHTESYFRTFADDIASRNREGVGIRPAIQDDGSTMSYAERYMTKMAFSIVETGDDNDGENLEKVGPGQCARIRELLKETGSDEADFLKLIAKTEKIEDISVQDFTRVMNPLQTKLREKSKNSNSQGASPKDSRPNSEVPGGATQGREGVRETASGPEAGKQGTVNPTSKDSASAQNKPDPTKDWVDNSGPKKPEKLTEKLLKQMEAAKTIQALQLIGEQCKTAPESEREILRQVYAARMKQLQAEASEAGDPDEDDRVCTDEQFDELTGIRMDKEVPPAKWFQFVKNTLGYAKTADLKRKDFQRARKWCEQSGKE